MFCSPLKIKGFKPFNFILRAAAKFRHLSFYTCNIMISGGEKMQTIYADVLVILNTYVNFALLRLTALIDKSKVRRLRIFLGALLGGFYSLIILCENIGDFTIFLSKAAVSVLMVLIAFGYDSLRGFLRSFAVFFGVSFGFAGLMFALWLFAAPNSMVFNNGTVYFNFDTMTLLILTALSYALVRLIFLFAERRTPKGSIYELKITVENTDICCRGLLDSGSSLCDWYTSLPVILISPELIEKIPESFFEDNTKTRLIPAQTAGGETLIRIFKPQSIHIKGIDCDISHADAYIGISNTRLRNGEFRAIIPHALIKEEAKNA